MTTYRDPPDQDERHRSMVVVLAKWSMFPVGDPRIGGDEGAVTPHAGVWNNQLIRDVLDSLNGEREPRWACWFDAGAIPMSQVAPFRCS